MRECGRGAPCVPLQGLARAQASRSPPDFAWALRKLQQTQLLKNVLGNLNNGSFHRKCTPPQQPGLRRLRQLPWLRLPLHCQAAGGRSQWGWEAARALVPPSPWQAQAHTAAGTRLHGAPLPGRRAARRPGTPAGTLRHITARWCSGHQEASPLARAARRCTGSLRSRVGTLRLPPTGSRAQGLGCWARVSGCQPTQGCRRQTWKVL